MTNRRTHTDSERAQERLDARWKRTQDGADRLVCGGHMAQRREDDGLDPLKDTD